MTEEELLERVQRALQAQQDDGDVETLVARAVADARDEVATIVRRLAVRSLLSGVAGHLEDERPGDLPARRTAARQEGRPARATRGEPEPPPPMQRQGTPAVYVYAVTRADAPAPEPPLRRVSAGALAAVVRDVRREDFEEGSPALEDPARLEELVRGHDQVLRRLDADVLPLRFGSLFEDDERVCHMLEDRGDALRPALDRLAGHAEWGLRVRARPGDLQRWLTEHARDLRVPEDAGDGVRWLASRRRENDLRDAAARRSAEVAEAVHRTLGGVAEGAERRDPEPGAALDATFLVRDEAAFEAAVEQVAERFGPTGFDLELTGPWPPYSFVPDVAEAG